MTGRAPKPDPQSRDHLFVSYAWEDGALCEWLFRKLTALGYAVWCDRFKLLAGSDWPKDIDVAIKTRTFRLIAILSRASLEKPSPAKERRLALNLGHDRSEQFLIPLNADGLSRSELPWDLTDLTYVPFTRWDVGLRQLVETLEQISTPKPRVADGSTIAIRSFLPANVLLENPERAYLNCLKVTQTPPAIVPFDFTRALAAVEEHDLAGKWAFRLLGPTRALAFTSPPSNAVSEWAASRGAPVAWKDVDSVEGIKAFDLVTELVRKSLMVRCVGLGLERDDEGRSAFFPRRLLPRDRISYRNYNGRQTYVNVLGERRKGRNRFQLGLTFWPRATAGDGLTIELKVRLRVTDPTTQLTATAANSRRKAIAKNWWNHEWLGRQMAIASFLAHGPAGPTADASEFIIGQIAEERVKFSAKLLTALVSPSIDERRLKAMRARVLALQAQLAVDADEDADNVRDESELGDE